ncbi:protein-cysteine N-palmitoyltransferase Rasp isoform X2 [Orussus abietinus]|nr:protein-cysteine N-palmitoyltransferase Rasp isoform X2 [Orussus abietinus]
MYNDFGPGWSWLDRKQDISDVEWNTWIPLMYKIGPWIFVHCFIGQYIKYSFGANVLCIWYILISILFLSYFVGIVGMLCMLIQPCIACLLTAFRSKSLSWIIHLSSLALIYLTKMSDSPVQYWLKLNEEEYYMFIIGICWIQLRSISYSIDSIVNYKHKNLLGFLKELSQNAAYCLYLPTLFLGPVLLYSEFLQGINKKFESWTFTRLSRLLFNLLRYGFWLYFTEFAMHFIYCNALQYHPQIVENLDAWAFYGYGYCMGQYFLNKYVVVYGICGEISRTDGIDAPATPKCIGRIHLYSDMWKHFDRGLYNFLIKYIYIPIVTELTIPCKKLVASFLCFGFVFLWHGMKMFIFIWACLNFIGLAIEDTAKSIGKSLKYIEFERKCLNWKNTRRFHCAIASPLLAMSAISNFYFFAGEEIGNIFVYRAIHDPWNVKVLVLFILHCCCHVSTDIKIMEIIGYGKSNI